MSVTTTLPPGMKCTWEKHKKLTKLKECVKRLEMEAIWCNDRIAALEKWVQEQQKVHEPLIIPSPCNHGVLTCSICKWVGGLPEGVRL